MATENHLLEELAGLRKRAEVVIGPITDKEWHLAVEQGWADLQLEYLDPVGPVCDELLRARAASAGPGHQPMQAVEVPEALRHRDQAVAHLLAAELDQSPELQALRQDLLNEDRLLDPVAVPAWLAPQVSTDHPPDSVEIQYHDPDHQQRRHRAFAPRRRPLGELGLWARMQNTRAGWDPADATMFALTGTIPAVSAVTASLQRRDQWPVRSRIVLEIDPAVTPEQLMGIYRTYRRSVLTGSRPRSLDPDTLDLGLFIADQELGRHPDTEPLTWAQRQASWNDTHRNDPDRQYPEHSPKRFARDARRAKTLLLTPGYLGEHHD